MLTVAMSCLAAREGVSDDFRKLKNIGNKTLLKNGMEYVDKCKYDSALICFSMVVNRYYDDKENKENICDAVTAILDIGIIYMTCDYDYRKAYDYLLQARDLAEKNGARKQLPYIYNCLANILQMSQNGKTAKNFREVMEMLRKSFYCSYDIGDNNSLSLAMINIIVVGIESGCNISKELSDYCNLKCRLTPSRRYAIKLCMAYKLYREGKLDDAEQAFRQTASIPYSRHLAYRDTLTVYNCLISFYTKTRQNEKLKGILLDAVNESTRNNSDDYIPELYRKLSEVYANEKNSEKARLYDYLYLKSSEKLMSREWRYGVENVKFVHDLEKANLQVRMLSEHRRMQNILLCVALVVVVVIGSLLYRLSRAYKNIREKNLHLYEKMQTLLQREEKDKQRHIAEVESSKGVVAALSEKNATADVEASDKRKEERVKYQRTQLPDDYTKALYSKILYTLETSDEIYHLGFNLDKLSELINVRSRYVSQAINQEYGSNFNSLLNDYRIKEACRRLNGDRKYSNMTIGAIALSVGFKSRTSFCALFKSVTGMSPTSYQVMAKTNQKE